MFRSSSDKTAVIEFDNDRVHISKISRTSPFVATTVFELSGVFDAARQRSLHEFFPRTPCDYRILVLFPQSRCRMRVFHLPSSKRQELLDMVAMQFVRLTPNRRDEMIVDIQLLEKKSAGQITASGVMTTREFISPVSGFLEATRITPAVIAPGAQRLLPLARRLFENNFLSGKGFILVLGLDHSVSFGFMAHGQIVFSREENAGADIDGALEMFVDYCRMEFSSIQLAEVAIIDATKIRSRSKDIRGIPVATYSLADLTRSADEKRIMEISSRAFLDFLLVREPGIWNGFDLSPAALKERRRLADQRLLSIHVSMIVVALLLGIALQVGAHLKRSGMEAAFLRESIAQDAVRVRELENKIRIVSDVNTGLAGRVSVAVLLGGVSNALPADVRIAEFRMSGTAVEIRGESSKLESAQAFARDLGAQAAWSNVRLNSIDKRPTETGETVLFSVSGEAKKWKHSS